MNRSVLFVPLFFVPLVAGLLFAGAARAQARGCPQLPADSDLIWQHRASGAADFCRALRANGSEAFGLYISPEPTFDPQRGNREEPGRIDGREIHWYRAELAGRPGVEARETLIELRDGRMAHVWLQADSGKQLQRMFRVAEALDFNPLPPVTARPDTQVAAEATNPAGLRAPSNGDAP